MLAGTRLSFVYPLMDIKIYFRRGNLQTHTNLGVNMKDFDIFMRAKILILKRIFGKLSKRGKKNGIHKKGK